MMYIKYPISYELAAIGQNCALYRYRWIQKYEFFFPEVLLVCLI